MYSDIFGPDYNTIFCKNVEECQVDSCGDNAHCVDDHSIVSDVNDPGYYTTAAGASIHCECDAGYENLDENNSCSNINECANDADNKCDKKANSSCVDTDGGFTCDCEWLV